MSKQEKIEKICDTHEEVCVRFVVPKGAGRAAMEQIAKTVGDRGHTVTHTWVEAPEEHEIEDLPEDVLDHLLDG